MPTHTQIHVVLPEDWEQYETSPRQYRQRKNGSGTLTISVFPTHWPVTTSPDTLRAHLSEMLAATGMETGIEKETGAFEGRTGLTAYSVRLSPTQGVLGFWLIIPDSVAMIFCSFAMGEPADAVAQLMDAQDIVAGLRIERQAPDEAR